MKMIPEIVQFELPNQLACPQPTERRGINRDEVRLLITEDNTTPIHTQFKHLADYLNEGDVLVVNTSGTIASAFEIDLPNNRKGRLHLSTSIGNDQWLVEVREVSHNRTIRWRGGTAEMSFSLPAGGKVTLKEQYYDDRELLHLWVAQLETPFQVIDYLQQYARPIQYENLHNQYPIAYYNTWFSSQPGSAEMPSAGRGFTSELIQKLLKKGVQIVPILLHTGVSSLEENEAPYPEYMEITPIAAAMLNQAKAEKKRILAVGTTAVRAVESAVDNEDQVIPKNGYTSLYIQPEQKLKIVSGLLTGFHEPRASHLNMLQALAGYDHISTAYQAAIENQYYWHQFGDLHLILS